MKAYSLGSRLTAEGFRKAVLHALIKKFVGHRATPYYEPVTYAFANLPPADPVLSLLVDAHCREYKPGDDVGDTGEAERQKELPHAFLERANYRYSVIVSKVAQKKLNPCKYHGHASDAARNACQEMDVGKGELSDSDLSDTE